MEKLITIIITVIGVAGSVGLFIGGAGFIWQKFMSGNSEAKSEANKIIKENEEIKEFYKKQNEELKIINSELVKKINDMSREIGEIKGQLNAETQQKAEILRILQGRDPETKQFQENMIKTMKQISDFISEIHTMNKQNIIK